MSGRPAVSAIIIVFNGEAFLDEAIASVRAQTWDDWELLVVDDGSTDASREIAGAHAKVDPRIRLLSHPDRRNHGMSATRNVGLSEARGRYVGFLDADDVWEPTKLDEQLAAFEAHPHAAMVYGRTLIWHSWDERAVASDHFYDLGVPTDQVHAPPLLFRNLLRNVYQTPTTCNALITRWAIDDVGGFEAEFDGMFEDQVFFAKVLLRFPVYVSDRCWAKYRQHTASSSATSLGAGADEAHQQRYLRWLRHHVASTPEAGFSERRAVGATLLALRRRQLARAVRRWVRSRGRAR